MLHLEIKMAVLTGLQSACFGVNRDKGKGNPYDLIDTPKIRKLISTETVKFNRWLDTHEDGRKFTLKLEKWVTKNIDKLNK